MTVPLFAIVGHPNKGKSSIVSTLAQDESVAISPIPGTTVDNRYYPMVVDGETLYALVDTPGFQRARAALEWMRKQPGSTVDRANIVRMFVEEHHDDPRFAAESSLLTPILDGAGILYVVDGSRPFGEEYEAEMEILRWTGQPSLALINMIGDADYSEDWDSALGQYFRIVRVFDAMTADFDKRAQLLLAFGQIRQEWRDSLENAVRILGEEQQRRRQQSARIIAETISHMISYTRQRSLGHGEATSEDRDTLQEEYERELMSMEQRCRSDVEHIYDHKHLERHEPLVELLEHDLFARQTWKLFGLTRQQLIASGALGGAATGGVIDLAVGGASLLLGAGIGAMVGGVSAWVTADRIADIEILGLPLGGKQLSIGPMRNINFPYVVLNRALYHHRMVEDRSHAHRDPLMLTQAPGWLQTIDADHRKRLEKTFVSLRRQDSLMPEPVDTLAGEIQKLMQRSASQTA
jgi:GTPase Era involved in 16S rRNA processing